MTNELSSARRGAMVKMAAAVAASAVFASDQARAAPAPAAATGKAGDFDFLTGDWKIAHRRLKDQQWISFDGEATVFGILGGIASVEELRIPSQNFSGMGLRMLDVERKLWGDYWVNSTTGVLGAAPTWGSFADGVGRWDAIEVDAGKAVIVRGEWDLITPQSCRWRQAVSHDDGKTWHENWRMHWQRA